MSLAHGTPPRVSMLVPVTPPDYPLDRLYREFSQPLERVGLSYEFVFVFQDWNTGRVEALRLLREQGAPIRFLVTGDAQPESALAHIAAAHTTAPILVTLPSYPRVAADTLPALIRALDEGPDLVAAVRSNEGDRLVNRVQRKAFHFLLGRMVGGRFHDIASGVRAMRRQVLEEMDLYGDFFRFLPMLAVRDGFVVEELRVEAHDEDQRNRVYLPGVYLRRLVDLVGMMFLVRFTYKPLRFFGMIGSGLLGTGGVILVVLLVQRLGGRGIADRPLLLLGVLLVVVGVQALAMGLIGEIVVHHNVSKRPLYRLRDPSGPNDADAPSTRVDADSV